MPEFEHTIRIDAPTEIVFEFLLDPDTALAANASVHEMTDKIMGFKTDGDFEAAVVEPNEELVYRFDGVGMNGTLTWQLRDVDGSTELTEIGDYEMTGTALDHVLEPVAARYNERQFQTALRNLKTYVEEQVAIEA